MVVELALAGAGLIGRRHAEAIAMTEGVRLTAVADPAPELARDVAGRHGASVFPNLAEMLSTCTCDGVILATPNAVHREGALACIDAGLPVLVEKPIADDLEAAREIVHAAEKAGIAVLVGHHRRHNPLVRTARALIDEGRLGRIATVQATTWLTKPDAYFDVAWRRQTGGGPILINLIHDIDLMRHLCGPISEITAHASNAVRGFEVEDSAAILLRFESGALGTMTVTDAVSAPWSWELTARENPAYPATNENCYLIGGTEGALALPSLTLWSHRGDRSWWAPISATRMPFAFTDPLIEQVAHFARVIEGREAPRVSGAEGLAALEAIEAVRRSATEGRTVSLPL